MKAAQRRSPPRPPAQTSAQPPSQPRPAAPRAFSPASGPAPRPSPSTRIQDSWLSSRGLTGSGDRVMSGSLRWQMHVIAESPVLLNFRDNLESRACTWRFPAKSKPASHPSLSHASGRRVLMTFSPCLPPWPRCGACWNSGPRSGWGWGPRSSGVLTASAARSSRLMLMSKCSGPQAASLEAPPTPRRLPTEVLSCPSTGLVPVLPAWSPGSQSVGAQSQRGWRVGHRPPAEPELRAAAGDPDCGPLVMLRPQAVSPRAAAHLAGRSVSSLPRPEAPAPTSRDLTHGCLPSARGRYLGDHVGALFPGRVLKHRVRPLALWACRLVRGSGKTELGRLWWGSPLSDAFAVHLGAGPEAGGRSRSRGGADAWWAGRAWGEAGSGCGRG